MAQTAKGNERTYVHNYTKSNGTVQLKPAKRLANGNDVMERAEMDYERE